MLVFGEKLLIVVGLITCEGWGSANEPRSSWRRSAQGWSSPRRGSEESEVVRVREGVHVPGVMLKCGVTYGTARWDVTIFGQDTMRKASCCAWATHVREVNAWRDDWNLKDNCDNRLGQARWQHAQEKKRVRVVCTCYTHRAPNKLLPDSSVTRYHG